MTDTPADIDGLLIWLDASQLELGDGDPVSPWPDLSDSGYDLTALTAGKPSYVMAGHNDLAVVRFDGATRMTLRAASSSSWQHFFVVTFYDTATFSNYDGLLGGPGGNDIILIGNDAQTYFYQHYASNTTYWLDGTNIPGQSHPAPMGGVMRQLNITKVTPWTMQLQMGEDRETAGRYWDGDVAEVLGYDSTLAVDDRQWLEGYLAWKWGLTAYLPSDHPWKTTDPRPAPPVEEVATGGGISRFPILGASTTNTRYTSTTNTAVMGTTTTTYPS